METGEEDRVKQGLRHTGGLLMEEGVNRRAATLKIRFSAIFKNFTDIRIIFSPHWGNRMAILPGCVSTFRKSSIGFGVLEKNSNAGALAEGVN